MSRRPFDVLWSTMQPTSTILRNSKLDKLVNSYSRNDSNHDEIRVIPSVVWWHKKNNIKERKYQRQKHDKHIEMDISDQPKRPAFAILPRNKLAQHLKRPVKFDKATTYKNIEWCVDCTDEENTSIEDEKCSKTQEKKVSFRKFQGPVRCDVIEIVKDSAHLKNHDRSEIRIGINTKTHLLQRKAHTSPVIRAYCNQLCVAGDKVTGNRRASLSNRQNSRFNVKSANATVGRRHLYFGLVFDKDLHLMVEGHEYLEELSTIPRDDNLIALDIKHKHIKTTSRSNFDIMNGEEMFTAPQTENCGIYVLAEQNKNLLVPLVKSSAVTQTSKQLCYLLSDNSALPVESLTPMTIAGKRTASAKPSNGPIYRQLEDSELNGACSSSNENTIGDSKAVSNFTECNRPEQRMTTQHKITKNERPHTSGICLKITDRVSLTRLRRRTCQTAITGKPFLNVSSPCTKTSATKPIEPTEIIVVPTSKQRSSSHAVINQKTVIAKTTPKATLFNPDDYIGFQHSKFRPNTSPNRFQTPRSQDRKFREELLRVSVGRAHNTEFHQSSAKFGWS